MPVTIKDIARQLNISISTVSYALNDGPRPVPADIKAKVLAVAQELNYRPNSLARSMATGRTDTIAVVPPSGGHPMLLSPYLLTVLNGIMEAAETLEQDVLLHTVRGDREPMGSARSVFSGKVDGVLLIAPDNAVATYQAMAHLYALGHRHVAHVAGKAGLRDAEERRAAYQRFLEEKGMPAPHEWLVTGDFTYKRGREAALHLLALPDRPTAVLAGNDESGLGVIDAALELGLRIPADLSVIAFDVLPQSFQQRSLSSVRQPIHQMAMEAVYLLTQWAQSGNRPEPARRVFPTELVELGSTAPLDA